MSKENKLTSQKCTVDNKKQTMHWDRNATFLKDIFDEALVGLELLYAEANKAFQFVLQEDSSNL